MGNPSSLFGRRQNRNAGWIPAMLDHTSQFAAESFLEAVSRDIADGRRPNADDPSPNRTMPKYAPDGDLSNPRYYDSAHSARGALQ
jgi:hypothetical protein